MIDHHAVGSLPGDSPPPTGAAAVAAWWNGQTDDMRQLWVAERPAEVGGLEGVPLSARHAANQNLAGRHFTVLDAELETTEAHVEAARARSDEEGLRRLRIRRSALSAQHSALGEWFAQIAEYRGAAENTPIYTVEFDPGSVDSGVPVRFVVSIGAQTVTHRLGESTLFHRDEQGRLRLSFIDVFAGPEDWASFEPVSDAETA